MTPKVSAEHLEQKRQQVLDAAFRVCMRKPMYEVSMRDIISETGFSQGNIYRYFSNLDEILLELINQRRIAYDVKTAVDAAIASDHVPEQIIGTLFEIWEKAVLDNILGVGKIFYEMCAVYANDHERLMHYISNSHTTADESYFKEAGFTFVVQKVEEGYFKPKLPIEDIFMFLGTSFDGIIRDLIISAHYNAPIFPQFDKSKLVKSLCTAFVLLLGGDETLLYPSEENTSS